MPVLTSAAEWETWLDAYPNAHLLQRAAWGQLKDPFGWAPAWVQAGDAGAQV